jgi:hypothetical protein
MNDIDLAALTEEVRLLAANDAPLVKMFAAVQTRLGEKRVPFEVYRVFRRVFEAPLPELVSILDWTGFESGNPGWSDDELEARFGKRIRASLRALGPSE